MQFAGALWIVDEFLCVLRVLVVWGVVSIACVVVANTYSLISHILAAKIATWATMATCGPRRRRHGVHAGQTFFNIPAGTAPCPTWLKTHHVGQVLELKVVLRDLTQGETKPEKHRGHRGNTHDLPALGPPIPFRKRTNLERCVPLSCPIITKSTQQQPQRQTIDVNPEPCGIRTAGR